MSLYSWDPVTDLHYSAYVGWGGWSPSDLHGTTHVPFGTCSLHGSWDTSRFFACPGCSSAALVQFRVYPELPEVPPPVLEVVFRGEERPHKCPVCEGTAELPDDFYARLGFATNTGGKVPCRSCENGIVWR